MTEQIIPFNETRFAECLAYLSAAKGATLDKFEAVKLHVMIDVLHTLKHGVPVIGGTFEPWMNGPLEPEAYLAVTTWMNSFDQSQKTDLLRTVQDDRDEMELKATKPVDRDEFSSGEIEAMEAAWAIVIKPDREEVQNYFHTCATPIGRAYEIAKKKGKALIWEDILDAYDSITGSNSAHVKVLIRS